MMVRECLEKDKSDWLRMGCMSSNSGGGMMRSEGVSVDWLVIVFLTIMWRSSTSPTSIWQNQCTDRSVSSPSTPRVCKRSTMKGSLHRGASGPIALSGQWPVQSLTRTCRAIAVSSHGAHSLGSVLETSTATVTSAFTERLGLRILSKASAAIATSSQLFHQSLSTPTALRRF